MIAYLDGTLAYKDPALAIMDINGVGYEVRISLATYSKLPAEGEKAKIYTYQHIKEDGQTLYGFLDPNEKVLFMLLISVSGIGPGTGIVMVSRWRWEKSGRPSFRRTCALFRASKE